MAPIAPLAIALASGFALVPSVHEAASAVHPRTSPDVAGVVMLQEDPPEDPTIDKAGRQMIILLGGLTGGVLSGKALFRR